eukprot:m.245003 g.245003  ORF g.245003 m.245003 type:complete len:486 (-) comp33833_c11_seq32:2032-3489(-)
MMPLPWLCLLILPVVTGRTVLVPVSAATPTMIWSTELCSKGDLWKAGVQMAKANVLVCQSSTNMDSVYAINTKDGSVVFEATDVQPGTLNYELDSVGETLYALQPILPPYTGYNLTKFQPKPMSPSLTFNHNGNPSRPDHSTKNAPPQWPRQEPVLYAGWMAAPLTSVTKGVLKQWDASGVGLCDHSVEVDWVGELEFPVTPYGTTLTKQPVYDDTSGSSLRPVGIVSWYFSKTEQFLYRLDGKSDPDNATLLLPEWRIKIATDLPDAYSTPPDFYIANDGKQDIVVLLDTSNEAPHFRLFAVATGKELTPSGGYPLPDFGANTGVSLTPSNAGLTACVHTWTNPPPPPPPAPTPPPPTTPPRPTPNPHTACMDITSGKMLWSLPMYHRILHPADGWQNHEIGGPTISVGANTLVQQTLQYVFNEDGNYWGSHQVRIRAFSKSSGKPLWNMPAPDHTLSWWINADITGEETFFVSVNSTLSKYAM